MSETRWTDAFLEPMRTVGDPLADQTIQAVIDSGGPQALEAVLRSLARNDAVVPEDLPLAVQDYCAQTARLPSWADPTVIVKGQEIFDRYGAEITAILLCASLPSCYALAKGVHVLLLSRQLSEYVDRRINETARFMFDVMMPGSLVDNGLGVRATQNIRLLHATMRHIMLSKPAWQADWGYPLNQEDMAFTLMTFSVVVLDGLRRLNIALTPDEQAAYFHVWNVVGTILGVHPSLLPSDAEDGRALVDTIRRRQYGPSEAGTTVTTALITFLQHIIPGTVFDGFVVANIRFLVGAEVSDMLDVPEPHWTRALTPLLKRLREFAGDPTDRPAILTKLIGTFRRDISTLERRELEIFNKMFGEFSVKLLQALELVERGGDRPNFHVPDALRARWGLQP